MIPFPNSTNSTLLMLRCALQQRPTWLHFLNGRCAISQTQANSHFPPNSCKIFTRNGFHQKGGGKGSGWLVGKRKAPPTLQVNGSKKPKIISSSSDPLRQPHDRAQEAEENGIVLRKFYPPEMSNARAQAYNTDQLPRPIELLDTALKETAKERAQIEVKDASRALV